MKFAVGKIRSGHFWYTNFWVPDPAPPPPPRTLLRGVCTTDTGGAGVGCTGGEAVLDLMVMVMEALGWGGAGLAPDPRAGPTPPPFIGLRVPPPPPPAPGPSSLCRPHVQKTPARRCPYGPCAGPPTDVPMHWRGAVLRPPRQVRPPFHRYPNPHSLSRSYPSPPQVQGLTLSP